MTPPLVSLETRTIVVTGAAQGIGKAIVERAIDLGANVVALDANSKTLGEALAPLPPARVMGVRGNVLDDELAVRTVAEAVARFGSVHGLVNNAGIVRPAPIEDMTPLQWQEVIDVHITGSFYWTRAVGRHMLGRAKSGDRSGGSVVNISSDAARKGALGMINYAAAKAGLLGMTMTAAREWGRHNIRANSVCFGLIETQMSEMYRTDALREKMRAQIPLGDWTTPAKAAEAVCFLLSDAAAYITGQHLPVDGGFHISI